MYAAIIILLAQLIHPGLTNVHYTKQVTIAPKPKPNTITIVYDDLFPGNRSERGGCYFMDVTKPGSLITIVEDKPDHVTVRGMRDHMIKWDCNWNVTDPSYKGPVKP